MGVWDEATKTERKNSCLLLGMLLTIAISYPLICLELLLGTGKMEMKKHFEISTSVYQDSFLKEDG